MAEPTETTQESNVLKINHKGNAHEFDLSNADDVKRLTDLAAKGFETDKLFQERASFKGKAEQFDQIEGYLKSAQSDDEAFDSVVSWLEESTGRKLTRKEKQQVEDFDFDETDSVKLKKELDDLRRTIEKDKKLTAAQKLEAELDKVVGNKDKFPFADKDEMISRATELGITNWNLVYKDLYHDKTVEAEIKKEQEKTKKLLEKRKMAVSESGGLGGLTATKPKAKNLREAGNIGLQRLVESGKSLIK